MWITNFYTFLVRLPDAYILDIVLYLELNSIRFTASAEIVLRCIAFALYFVRGRSVKVRA